MLLTDATQELQVLFSEAQVVPCPWTVGYTEGKDSVPLNGLSNGSSPVTLFTGPTGSDGRRLARFTMNNVESATSHEVTVWKFDGANVFEEVTILIQPGETLIYNRLKGWYVFRGTQQVPAGDVLAGPTEPGTTGAPTFRPLEPIDIPSTVSADGTIS